MKTILAILSFWITAGLGAAGLTYTVCPAGCTSTTVSGAFTAASLDAQAIIQLNADITTTGETDINYPIAALQSDNGSRVWTCTAGSHLIQIQPGVALTTTMTVKNIVLRKATLGQAQAFIAISGTANLGIYKFQNVTFFADLNSQNSSFGIRINPILNSQAQVLVDSCFFKSQALTWTPMVDNNRGAIGNIALQVITGSVRVQNTIITGNFYGTGIIDSSTADNMMDILNCTIADQRKDISLSSSARKTKIQNLASFVGGATTVLTPYPTTCSGIISSVMERTQACGDENSRTITAAVASASVVNYASGNFYPSPFGVLVDKGTTNTAYTWDYLGVQRPFGYRFDVGAIESTSTLISGALLERRRRR